MAGQLVSCTSQTDRLTDWLVPLKPLRLMYLSSSFCCCRRGRGRHCQKQQGQLGAQVKLAFIIIIIMMMIIIIIIILVVVFMAKQKRTASRKHWCGGKVGAHCENEMLHPRGSQVYIEWSFHRKPQSWRLMMLKRPLCHKRPSIWTWC